MCISFYHKKFNLSLGEVGFLEEFLDRIYKIELLGKCSNVILVLKDTNCYFYIVDDSRTNLFDEKGNHKNPCASSCGVLVDFGRFNYSCYSQVFKHGLIICVVFEGVVHEKPVGPPRLLMSKKT